MRTYLYTSTLISPETSAAHDFFEAQPHKNASVFLLKFVCHDWADQYCVKFLTNLRHSATASTTLVVIDIIVPLACRDNSGGLEDEIPGAKAPAAPEPLLSNYGVVNEWCYNADVNVGLARLFT